MNKNTIGILLVILFVLATKGFWKNVFFKAVWGVAPSKSSSSVSIGEATNALEPQNVLQGYQDMFKGGSNSDVNVGFKTIGGGINNAFSSLYKQVFG